jgi:tetratricopeptide (TPR) repeat protein
LHFWRGTAQAVPNSAKAHLNYGVMLGARGDLEERLKETARALQIAPQWPMAHVYLGDTLCRLQRTAEAWPHYLRGFEIGPNEPNLIALGLQCLWDQQQFTPHQVELMNLGAQFPGSWLDYLVTDTFENGTQNGGVSPKYRPRGYDEGPSDP